MREVFKKLVDGSVVNIEIDVDADEFKSGRPWLFSVFVKYEGLDETKDGYEDFLETKESLIIALEYTNKTKYVGSRIIDGWSEFYFHCEDSKELNAIVTKMLSSTTYIYESNVVRDTKWNFYETQLFPTELELHHIESAKIIFLLQEEEDDLSVEREVEHYAVFDTATQKERFVQQAKEFGFAFKDDIATDEYEHGVALVKFHMPRDEEVQKIVEELFVLIKKEHGYYEGWSTTLSDDRSLANEEENSEL